MNRMSTPHNTPTFELEMCGLDFVLRMNISLVVFDHGGQIHFRPKVGEQSHDSNGTDTVLRLWMEGFLFLFTHSALMLM